jgi:hypothetical protein
MGFDPLWFVVIECTANAISPPLLLAARLQRRCVRIVLIPIGETGKVVRIVGRGARSVCWFRPARLENLIGRQDQHNKGRS